MWKYYKRVFAVAWKDFKSTTQGQVIGVAIAICILIFQIRYGIVKTRDIHANARAIVWPYAILILGFFIYHLLRAPHTLNEHLESKLATAQQKEADVRAELDNEIGKREAPKLFLEYSEKHSAQFLTHSGLIVRNGGTKVAFSASLSCDPSAKVRLCFEGMPIQKIDPAQGEPIKVRTEYLDTNGVWYPVGGDLGGQIESCFERLNYAGLEETIPVTINYADYEGRGYTTLCVIRREGVLFLSKRIWCELVRLSGLA
jgi:hypothetical protein